MTAMKDQPEPQPQKVIVTVRPEPPSVPREPIVVNVVLTAEPMPVFRLPSVPSEGSFFHVGVR